ncbi:unnamed protein product, partial [Ectocarpus sp. 6 AP-2014]
MFAAPPPTRLTKQVSKCVELGRMLTVPPTRVRSASTRITIPSHNHDLPTHEIYVPCLGALARVAQIYGPPRLFVDVTWVWWKWCERFFLPRPCLPVVKLFNEGETRARHKPPLASCPSCPLNIHKSPEVIRPLLHQRQRAKH